MAGQAVYARWRAARNTEECDVEFLVMDENNKEKCVSAHKQWLAIWSPVWHQQFLGPLSQAKSRAEREIVRIEGVCAESFATFIDLIYGNQDIMEHCQIHHLFELFLITDRYLVTERLRDLISRQISSFQITAETAVEVLKLVESCKHLSTLESLCQELAHKCLLIIHKELASAGDFGKLYWELADLPEMRDAVFLQMTEQPNTNINDDSLKGLAAIIESSYKTRDISHPERSSCQGRQVGLRVNLGDGIDSAGVIVGINGNKGGRVWMKKFNEIYEFEDLSIFKSSC